MTFFLFPGQGSQRVGMAKDFYEASSPAREILDQAEELNGPGFLDLIFDGEADKLNHTKTTQVALLAVEVAIAKHLIESGHEAAGCAGHSLGEIPALVIAGSLSFENAMELTKERGRLSSENVPEGAMAAVFGLASDKIEAQLSDTVQIGNYNSPGQTIISGTIDGIEAAEKKLTEAGAKRVIRLKVSGPFHSSCMKGAAEEFRSVLGEVEFAEPRIPFVSSVSAKRESNPDEIRSLLAVQLCSPVRWTQVMELVGPVNALEVGPGRVLQGLARRTNDAPQIMTTDTLEKTDALEIVK